MTRSPRGRAMLPMTIFRNATLVLPDRLVPNSGMVVAEGRIIAVGEPRGTPSGGTDLGGKYLAPGFVDVHVHGGGGGDFMGGTAGTFPTLRPRPTPPGAPDLPPTRTPAPRAPAPRCPQPFAATPA